MEPSENASSQPAKAMESQNGIGNGEKSPTTQHPVGGTINILSSSKKLNTSFSSNCSSPDTPLDSPFVESGHKNKSTAKEEVPSNLLATESPPTQVMEEPAVHEVRYRIPSSVFAQGKSRKELEWSMCSNESLFSIQLDNTSFCRDEFLLKTEEFCEDEEAFEVAPAAVDIAPVRPSSAHITELARAGGVDTAETSMRDFLRDSKNQNQEKCHVEERTSRYSDESGTSGRSFAFPILSGEIDKDGSAKLKTEKKQPPQPLPSPEQEGESPQQAPQPEYNVDAAPKQWFSCFMCCSFCS
ncbi:unnamed protein product [Cuscuta campestris]|uniref:Uncharacterized protein n=1 Tax=Cuscuta campestris TaxID=132261 RepID=A0A484LF73_9ASTE|nr:unnamed protein product [Cuscuta campestris]